MNAASLTLGRTLSLIKSDVAARIRYTGGVPGFWSGLGTLLFARQPRRWPFGVLRH